VHEGWYVRCGLGRVDCLCASFLAPLLAILLAVVRLQFSVTAMATTLIVLWSKAA
jgi:hypothetical protein